MNTNVLSIPGSQGPDVNVSAPERLLSVFAGGALAAMALKRRSWASAALATGGGMLLWRGMTGHCPGYQAAGINSAETGHKSQHTEQVLTIDATPERLYQFWRNFENLPQVMWYLESVQVLDEQRSRWRAKAPAGKTVEWEAEITNDVPNERIEWRSTGNATVPNAGSVEFRRAPGDRGTEVRVIMNYQTPAGNLGEGVAKLLARSPGWEIREDLRRLKQIIETGEIATIKGQPAAHRHSMFAAFSESAK